MVRPATLSALAGALLAGALPGCGLFESDADRAIAACERYIATSLRSPSSYQRVDTKVSGDRGGRGFWTVAIEYDADNAFGAAVRGEEQCAFATAEGTDDLPETAYLNASVARARAEYLSKQIDLESGRRESDRWDGVLECCLTEEKRPAALKEVFYLPDEPTLSRKMR